MTDDKKAYSDLVDTHVQMRRLLDAEIAGLRAALEEIINLPGERLDEAPTIASKALGR